ncbi:MAG TPA: CU044_2847 family protein [Streptosporangiaceae bacterium]|nr:CU044_2847 family protein [Streptosporangiaceae bacterium]
MEFPLEGGGSVLVQVDGARAGGQVTRGVGERRVTEQASQTFEQAVGRLRPVAQALITQLRALADVPDEVQVEFGLELSAEAGAFIAAASASANFKVSIAWHRVGPAKRSAGADTGDVVVPS